MCDDVIILSFSVVVGVTDHSLFEILTYSSHITLSCSPAPNNLSLLFSSSSYRTLNMSIPQVSPLCPFIYVPHVFSSWELPVDFTLCSSPKISQNCLRTVLLIF